MNYPLSEVGELQTFGDPPVAEGVLIRCPNCGAAHGAWFKNPIGDETPTFIHKVTWQRTGETLETLTLHPSFLAIGCYHSWIRDGQLCVDSPFTCKRRDPEAA
jgi:hypothetical protein